VLHFTLRNLRAYAPRFLATALAVIVGIGFMAAGLMLTGAMKSALLGSVDRQYAAVDAAVLSFIEFEGLSPGVAPEALEIIERTPGVAAAAGELTAPVRVLGDDGESRTSRTVGRAWIEDPGLSPLEIIDGTAPGDGVVLDRRTAADLGVEIGESLTLATPIGRVTRPLVGLSEFDGADSIDDGGTVSFAPADALAVLATEARGWDAVLVRGEPDSPDLLSRLAGELDSAYRVITGETLRDERQAVTAGVVDVLRPVLNGFAWVALFVAGFVIANTFAIVVAQRRRELALVRAIGGTPGQVQRALLAEGLAVGVVASALGIVTGALVSTGVVVAVDRLGYRLPGAGLSVTPLLVIGCLLAGTIVTTLAVLAPAIRAGRTRPVEAMREGAVDRSGTSSVRAVIGGILLGLGIMVLLGVQVLDWPVWMLGPGALSLFGGVVVGGPLLARGFARLMQPVAQRAGLTARLAVDNTVRNPRRTATTANALVIGLFLVTVVTTSGEAFKTWATDQLDALSASDFIVASSGAPIADDVTSAIDEVPGVRRTAPVRTTLVVGNTAGEVPVSGADVEALRETTGLEVVAGSLDDVIAGSAAAVVDFSTLTLGGIGDSEGSANSGDPGAGSPFGEGAGVGDNVELVLPDGTVRTLPVAATLRARIDSLTLGVLVSTATLEDLVGPQPVNLVYVRTDADAADSVGVELDRIVRDFTGIEVVPGNVFGQIVGQVLDFLIAAVNALLGVSIIVALVGIVNTTTLSIHERRSELGVVRALGTTRGQVGRMVVGESVLVAVLGTALGVGCGVFVGWVLIGTLGDGAVPFTLNAVRVGSIIAAGVLVGVIASIFPARRAVRIDVLDAIRAV